MPNRKLGKPSNQRVAMLRNLTSSLIMNGRIVTTESRAKEIRPIVEKLITLAIREYKNCDTVTVTRTIVDRKTKQNVEKSVERVVDRPSKLHARRLMLSYLYNIPQEHMFGEKNAAFRARVKERRYPVVERLFRDIAPVMDGRNGGYTRIVKMGPRRGDGAEEALIELIMPAAVEEKGKKAKKQAEPEAAAE